MRRQLAARAFERYALEAEKFAIRALARFRLAYEAGCRVRHSYAMHSLHGGIDMGHSDIKTTAIYPAIVGKDCRRTHREHAPLATRFKA